MRDDMPFFIDEMTAHKKIYHATDFGVALPSNLNLEYVKSLPPKEDSFWLKLSHITSTLKIRDINEMLDRKEKENIQLEAEVEGESTINY